MYGYRLPVPVIAALLALASLAWTASAAAATSRSAETVEAREVFFGDANVDRRGRLPDDRVLVSWFGVASLAVSFNGKVALLDTYLNSDPPASCGVDGSAPTTPGAGGYTPANYDQLTALAPKAIFVGHGHFDHECWTGPIASQSGARVVALPQACQLAREQAAAENMTDPVRCVEPLAADSPFGESAELTPIGRRVPVTALRNLHSGGASMPPMNSGGAESLMFIFRLGKFSLTWHNSSGPLRESAPNLLAALNGAPATDVEFGATLGFGLAEQGMRDAADYAEALRAKRFYSLHNDLFRNASLSAEFNAQAAAEFGSRGMGDAFRPLEDPGDYLQPIVFRPSSRKWGG